MRVLSVLHQADMRSGVFADAVAAAGHELVEWVIAEEAGPPLEPDAAIVLGGAMHVDQEERHGWLRDEDALLRSWLRAGTPVLGLCLGGQLLAKALGAPVRRMPSPEIGWAEVAREGGAADDPVFSGLPERFRALEWHSYAFELPSDTVPLARSDRCLQAFRAGGAAWGVQFHAEVTRDTVERWIVGSRPEEDGRLDREALLRESHERIPGWNELGAEICTRFLAVAASSPGAATTRATSPRSS